MQKLCGSIQENVHLHKEQNHHKLLTTSIAAPSLRHCFAASPGPRNLPLLGSGFKICQASERCQELVTVATHYLCKPQHRVQMMQMGSRKGLPPTIFLQKNWLRKNPFFISFHPIHYARSPHVPTFGLSPNVTSPGTAPVAACSCVSKKTSFIYIYI